MDRVASLGCAVNNCYQPATIHHCFTGMGRRKNHTETIGLCWQHHLGQEGIQGKKISKRAWESKYGTEEALLEKTSRMLE
jgi:hypothetical protein